MRWLKRVVIGTVSVVVVLVVLALVVPFLIPTSTYKDQIESRVKAATGRDFKLGGALKFSILPSLELSARDVSLGNRPGAEPSDMVKLRGLDLKLRLGPLLSGRFEVVALDLVEPAIVLSIDKNGTPNWQFSKPADGAAKKPAPQGAVPKPPEAAKPAALPTDIFNTLQIERLHITRGTVIYSDARTGAHYELAKANLDISLPGGNRPFKVDGDAEYKGKRIAIDTEVKAPVDMMKGQPSPLSLQIGLGEAKISFAGTAQADPAKPSSTKIAGTLKVVVPSLRDLANWAGSKVPEGKTFETFTLSTNVTASPDAVSLASLDVKLDQIAVTGELSATKGPVPSLRGTLTIPALDLGPYMQTGAATAPRKAPSPPPKSPARRGAAAPSPAPAIDAAPLRALNVDLKIDAHKISAGAFRAEQALIGIKLAGGVLAVALEKVLLYGGSVTGTVTIDGAHNPLTVHPDIDIKGLNGHAVLSALGATDRLDGTLNASANLTGTGNDAKSIQNSLAGTARFQFANGALRGYNLAGLFRALGDIRNPLEIIEQIKKAVASLNRFDGAAKTDFSSLSASFRVSKGVFATSDFRMAAPLIRIEGRGVIAPPSHSLDMHLDVKAVPTLQGQGSSFAKLGIPIPLHVYGPFSNVSWGLDEKAFTDIITKRAPELFKEQILKKPGDLLKKPGDLLKKPGSLFR
jgi:AsmA protein